MYYKIKEVSDMTGISVRMLHYYDKTGLLKPEKVSEAGYRLYTGEDVKKLSQILFYRELDFSLEEIKNILSSTNSYKLQVMKIQQQILSKKRDKIDALMNSISRSIKSLEMGEEVQDPDIFTSLDLAEISRNKEQLKTELMTHLFTHAEEDCGVKTSQYSKDEWTVVMSKADIILRRIYEQMGKGPAHAGIQELTGEFKKFINDNLIKCDSRTFKLLGSLYVENPLYRSYMEKYSGSFPEFIRNAIDIYEGNKSQE